MGNAAYLLDCYTKEFEAMVVHVDETGTIIMLDTTYFYPTSGGQPNDYGTIASGVEVFAVTDVVKKDGAIGHIVERPGLKVGAKVLCSVDWDRRYRLMRYHTASHILATLIHNETSAEITGNQLYLDKARVDFSLEQFDRSLMNSFQDKVNAIIDQNLAVSFRILEREEAFKIPQLVKLRKAFPESITAIRIVDIGDFDHQACGGTHLKNTREIGHIEIYELENKGKDRRRIYFRIPETVPAG